MNSSGFQESVENGIGSLYLYLAWVVRYWLSGRLMHHQARTDYLTILVRKARARVMETWIYGYFKRFGGRWLNNLRRIQKNV